jgi:hypothetical protein
MKNGTSTFNNVNEDEENMKAEDGTNGKLIVKYLSQYNYP